MGKNARGKHFAFNKSPGKIGILRVFKARGKNKNNKLQLINCMGKKDSDKDFSAAQIKKMARIIEGLKNKMAKIDRLKDNIEHKHISFSTTPKQTRILIEEIKVPSLELLRDETNKKN